jgi:hypothetical protein
MVRKRSGGIVVVGVGALLVALLLVNQVALQEQGWHRCAP